MRGYERARAEISLGAVTDNYDTLKKTLPSQTKVMAVVKADGYGHGAVPIAKALQDYDYIWGFATATPDEAVSLRESGIGKPILILGYVFDADFKILLERDIRPTIFKLDIAEKLNVQAKLEGKILPVHIKVDTGMTRVGFTDTKESADIIHRISKMEHLKVEGVFTHFARADEADKESAGSQLKRFTNFCLEVEKRGVTIPYKHCANSAATMEIPGSRMDLVRVGIAGYGIYPSDEMERETISLKPAMALKSRIVYIKEVEKGIPVSYGGTFITKVRTKIATIPIGYADGYPRSLSRKGWVLIRGEKAPILGRICMDQFMVDVTNIPDVSEMDEVILLGKSGEAEVTVDELGSLSGRFPYEFVCDIGKRIPRLYL